MYHLRLLLRVLSLQYQEKKQSMRNEWRNARELEDKFAFLYTLERNEVCYVL